MGPDRVLWVKDSWTYGGVTITSYHNAPPSVETADHNDDRGGWPMDAADLLAAADKLRELMTQGS